MFRLIKKITSPLQPTLGWGKTMSFKGFVSSMATSWVILNMSLVLFFALVYYVTDHSRPISYFSGIDDNPENRKFTDYLYFSVIVTSTLGLGEIVPKTKEENKLSTQQWRIGRGIVALHIMSSLMLNDMLDTAENYILA